MTNVQRFTRSEFVRHGFVVFVATSLINVFGYAYHFAISRKVGVEQYGVLSALNSVLMISTVFSGIVATVVVKYAAEFRATDDRAHLAALVRRLTIYGSIAAAIVVVLGALASGVIASYLKIASIPAVVLTTAIIGITIATPALRAVFQGIEDFNAFAISTCLESLFKLLVGVGLVYAGYGVVGAFLGWAVGSVIAVVYTAVVLLRRFRRVPDAVLYIDMRRLVKTMAGISAATVLLTSIANVDVLIVKHFADPTTAGLYGALALSGKILFFLVGFVPTVVLPKATRQALAGESPVGVFVQAVAVIAVMSGAGLVVYYFFPAFVITALAGASFAPAAPYVFAYGFAMVLLAALNVVVMYKIGIHRFDFVVPLAACAVGEIVGLSLHHRSLGDVIAILIAGNGIALAASAYRVNAPLRVRTGVTASDAAA
jgi:O-antigen/teichoic acid export membrane protein